MKDIEQEWKRALARRDPPDGFADRVLARLPERAGPSRNRSWLPAAAAFLIALLGAGAYEHHRQAEAVQAKSELMRALQVTSGTLQQAKAKLQKRTRGEL